MMLPLATRSAAPAKAEVHGRFRCISKTSTCKNFVYAAYRATILNADMVNLESICLKLAESCEKLPGKSVFLASKTTVNYNRRFDINHGAPGALLKLHNRIRALPAHRIALPHLGPHASKQFKTGGAANNYQNA
jgi:hypothetical protein